MSGGPARAQDHRLGWRKLGHVYRPDGDSTWACHSALQPTPMVLADKIRIFTGVRDQGGISRVAWVDVDRDDPTRILAVSANPALDIGEPGAFDENGVVPCALLPTEDCLRLYYAGYSLGHRVRFLVFGGAAISRDGGVTFERLSRVPVIDRTDRELHFRVIHSIMPDTGGYRVWYGGGDGWQVGADGYPLAVYDVRSMWSPDGLHFPTDYELCVPIKDDGDEHRVGRPYVVRGDFGYRMFFGAGTRSKLYRLAYAHSQDGRSWTRDDAALGIDEGEGGWDATMMGYPGIAQVGERVFMFYNGNDMGRAGFGVAEATLW